MIFDYPRCTTSSTQQLPQLFAEAFSSEKGTMDYAQNLASLLATGMNFVASPVITVLVGPPSINGNGHKLYIHKGKITALSRFFASALGGRWSTTDPNTIDMYKFDPDILPEEMTRYLEAVYDNKVLFDTLEQICPIYNIAEAMLDRTTRNDCVKSVY
jgi:hypothetical protein